MVEETIDKPASATLAFPADVKIAYARNLAEWMRLRRELGDEAPALPEVPAGWRRVAWVGDPETPVNEDGSYDAHAEARRIVPFWFTHKAGWLFVLRKTDGYSRNYIFGKGENPEDGFIKWLTDDDAERLLSSPGAHRFVDVTHDPDFYARVYRDTDELFHEGLVELDDLDDLLEE